MTQHPIIELAKQGQPEAIAALLTKALENRAKIQVSFRDNDFLIRVTAEAPLNQAEVVALLTKVLKRLECPIIIFCTIEAYLNDDSEPLWSESITLFATTNAAPPEIPNLAADENDSKTVTTIATTQLNPSKGSSWKFPGVNLNSIKQVGGQVADQAVKLAQDTATNTHGVASKATEQALRSSIDQTMNAFQIAVEQIHDRKLPAKMAALTGTINVGVIQLSIRLDIPMDEETGEIMAEIK